MVEDCLWKEDFHTSLFNLFVSALAITGIIIVMTQICRAEHGTRRINYLTLRPWKIALLGLFIVVIKALSN